MSPGPSIATTGAPSEPPDPLIWESFLWGLLSASSLNIGSVIGVTCLPKRKARAVLMAFGGGALLFALSVELFGHVLHMSDTTKKRAPVWIMEGSAVFGGLLFAMLNRFLNGVGADVRKASTTKGRIARMRAMLMRRLAVRLWKVQFFSTLSLEELKDLIQFAMYKERFNPGDIIMSETHESGIYFIISGMVRLQINSEAEADKKRNSNTIDDVDFDSTATPYTWDLGPNHIFGDMTILTGSYVSTIVEALETTKVLVLPGHEVSRLLDTNENVRKQVALGTVERLQKVKEFNSLPTFALASLSSRCTHSKFQPGEVIFSGTVDEETPILAVVLGSVELTYPLSSTRKVVHASCLICTEHFKCKECRPFTAVASAATFVLIIQRDALEEAMCMSPKAASSGYAWTSSRTKERLDAVRSSRSRDLHRPKVAALTLPHDVSIEPVESDEDVVEAINVPGQVKQTSVPEGELLILDEGPKQCISKEMDAASTQASTPALDIVEIIQDHNSPESAHPTPNHVAPDSIQIFETRKPRHSEQTEMELGRIAMGNLSSLGRNLGWDKKEQDVREIAGSKEKANAVASLSRSKTMMDIVQVTDQELAEQETCVREQTDEHRRHDEPKLSSPAGALASSLRQFRRSSKEAVAVGGELQNSQQPVWVSKFNEKERPTPLDLESGAQGNHLAVPPRPSITRTRTPSKQRVEFNLESQMPEADVKEAEKKGGHGGTGSHHAAIMVWLGILIDAVPESLVIGILVNKSTTDPDKTAAGAALPFVISVFLSNLPEAMSSSGSMKAHGMRVSSILLMWFVTTILTAIGALIGALAFPPSTISDESTELVVSGVEGLAAGAMLTMIAQTMMPEAFEQGGDIVGLSCLAGFLCAMTVKLIPV